MKEYKLTCPNCNQHIIVYSDEAISQPPEPMKLHPVWDGENEVWALVGGDKYIYNQLTGHRKTFYSKEKAEEYIKLLNEGAIDAG